MFIVFPVIVFSVIVKYSVVGSCYPEIVVRVFVNVCNGNHGSDRCFYSEVIFFRIIITQSPVGSYINGSVVALIYFLDVVTTYCIGGIIRVVITFYFSVAQVKHFQTVRERSDPEFVSVQAKSSYIEDLFFFFCQVIFLNFFTVYIVFEESFLGTYPDNTVKIILVKRVYDWIIRDNMLVEYLIFGYDMNCSGLIG